MHNKRTRALIEGRARDIILKVHKYFENERDHCRLLLQRLTGLTTLIQVEKEVKVPLTLLTDVLDHFKSTFQVSKRVVAATCISKNSLTKIKAEGVAAGSNTKMKTPKKKPRGKKKYFNAEEFEQLQKIIMSYSMNKKHDFKFRTLLSLVRRDLNYTGSLATLRRIMWDMGFRWEKKPGSAFVTFSDKYCMNINTGINCTEWVKIVDDFEESKAYGKEGNLCSNDNNMITSTTKPNEKTKFDEHQEMINKSLKTVWESINKNCVDIDKQISIKNYKCQEKTKTIVKNNGKSSKAYFEVKPIEMVVTTDQSHVRRK